MINCGEKAMSNPRVVVTATNRIVQKSNEVLNKTTNRATPPDHARPHLSPNFVTGFSFAMDISVMGIKGKTVIFHKKIVYISIPIPVVINRSDTGTANMPRINTLAQR